jgi:hypothetical protein
MIAGDNDTDDKFFGGINDTGEQLLPVTTALAINFCQYQQHRWTMIAGDNDAGDKFIASINDTGEQLSPLTTIPAITLFPGVVYTGHK